jgi:hypothetical protein
VSGAVGACRGFVCYAKLIERVLTAPRPTRFAVQVYHLWILRRRWWSMTIRLHLRRAAQVECLNRVVSIMMDRTLAHRPG